MTTSSSRDTSKLMTLNLGAGNYLIPDAVQHDKLKHREEIDVVWDLSVTPWPWPDERFSTVLARAVLEHLNIDLLTAMDEIWRIMIPGGKLTVKLPYWNHEMSYNDPSHRYPVGLGIFDQFDPRTVHGKEYSFYTDRKWHITKVVLNGKGTSVWGWLTKV